MAAVRIVNRKPFGAPAVGADRGNDLSILVFASHASKRLACAKGHIQEERKTRLRRVEKRRLWRERGKVSLSVISPEDRSTAAQPYEMPRKIHFAASNSVLSVPQLNVTHLLPATKLACPWSPVFISV